MVLTVRSYRDISIDISRAALGDILVVEMEQGTVNLMLCRYWDGLRWSYTKSSWLSADRSTVDRLISDNGSIKAFDGFGSVENSSINVYAPLSLSLDQPLRCKVGIRWENDCKGRDRRRTLGSFDSSGGLVRKVAAGVLPNIARSR